MTGTTTSRWCAPSPTMSTTTRTSRVVAATALTTRLPTTVPTVTPTLVAMTTDSPASPRSARPRRPGVSVRARITAALAALALVALTAAGLIVYVIERARIDEAVSRQVEQEIAEFEQLRTGNGPGDQRAVHECRGAVASLPVPQRAERRGAPRGLARQRPHVSSRDDDALAAAPAFIDARTPAPGQPAAPSGSPRRSGAPGHGPARPERQTSGALVVSINLDEVHQELNTHDAHLHDRRCAVPRPDRGPGRSGSPAAARAAADAARDREGDQGQTDLSRRIPETGNDDITALTGTVQRHARPARGGVHRHSGSSSTTPVTS